MPAEVALRLMVVHGPDSGVVFEVGRAGGGVGRAPGNAVKLGDPTVSRVHGALAPDGSGALVWRDASPRHPAQLDGRPADGRAPRPGDELVVGATRLLVLPARGGAALLDDRPSRVTAEVSLAELGGRRGRADLAALVALGDALAAASDRAAAAQALADVLRDALQATRVDVVAVDGGRLDPLATAERRPSGAPLSLARDVVTRAVAGGSALVLDDDRTLLAPIAGVGVVHVARAAPLRPAEVDLAIVAARLGAGGLAARAAHDATLRRAQALEARVGAPRILGESAAAEAVRGFVRKVGPADTTVLLTGESGTGKELVAAAIHHASARAAGPFVAVNCAALGDQLIESELFGHERGAFTGATERKLGRFELADGGTLLLDEVGELAPRAQAKLLRVLEDRRVDRVGGTRPLTVDVRVIAATNRDLEAMVARGEFRDDLYFRLSVIQLRLPALRERADDIPTLAAHFLDGLRGRTPRAVRGFTPDALAALRRHPWPGNVRELRNAVERALVLGDGPLIAADELAPGRAVAAPAAPVRTVRDAERDTIAAALAAAGGNKARAAAALGIDRTTLYKKLRAYGL